MGPIPGTSTPRTSSGLRAPRKPSHNVRGACAFWPRIWPEAPTRVGYDSARCRPSKRSAGASGHSMTGGNGRSTRDSEPRRRQRRNRRGLHWRACQLTDESARSGGWSAHRDARRGRVPEMVGDGFVEVVGLGDQQVGTGSDCGKVSSATRTSKRRAVPAEPSAARADGVMGCVAPRTPDDHVLTCGNDVWIEPVTRSWRFLAR